MNTYELVITELRSGGSVHEPPGSGSYGSGTNVATNSEVTEE